jgi:hypothetical protein
MDKYQWICRDECDVLREFTAVKFELSEIGELESRRGWFLREVSKATGFYYRYPITFCSLYMSLGSEWILIFVTERVMFCENV